MERPPRVSRSRGSAALSLPLDDEARMARVRARVGLNINVRAHGRRRKDPEKSSQNLIRWDYCKGEPPGGGCSGL